VFYSTGERVSEGGGTKIQKKAEGLRLQIVLQSFFGFNAKGALK
jgi:hypothetical protein